MKKYSMITLLLIPIGIAINVVGGQIAMALKLPIYIDSIGTILVSVLTGPLLGAITGLVTNIIISITNPTWLVWTPVNVLVGLVAGYCASKGLFKKPIGAIITAICVWAIVQISSAPISVYVFGGATGTGSSLITSFLVSTGKNLWSSVVTTNLITETIDKFISVGVVYLIVFSIPKRSILKFPLGNKYIIQSDDKEGWNEK